jgi:hypothetical protein
MTFFEKKKKKKKKKIIFLKGQRHVETKKQNYLSHRCHVNSTQHIAQLHRSGHSFALDRRRQLERAGECASADQLILVDATTILFATHTNNGIVKHRHQQQRQRRQRRHRRHPFCGLLFFLFLQC